VLRSSYAVVVAVFLVAAAAAAAAAAKLLCCNVHDKLLATSEYSRAADGR